MPHRILHPELFPSELLGFVDPDDYYSYYGIKQIDGTTRLYRDIYELLQHIEERREALGMDIIPYLQEQVEEYLYRLGEAPASLFIDEPRSSNLSRTVINDIITGAKLAKSLSKAAISGALTPGGHGWTTLSEAAERASICKQCPHNVPLSAATNSLGRRLRDKLSHVFTPLRSTPHDESLFECGICHCPLSSKVHYSREILREVSEHKATDFPEAIKGKDGNAYQCWLRKVLE